MKSPDEQIGERLRELRMMRNETQEDIGKLLDVHYTKISKIELGKRRLNNDDCIKLAEHFETTTEYIYTGVHPEAVDFFRKTGLNQRAIDALSQDSVFSAIINAMMLWQEQLTKSVSEGAKAIYDAKAKHVGEEYPSMDDYSTALDYASFRASKYLIRMFEDICKDPSVVRAVCGGEEV